MIVDIKEREKECSLILEKKKTTFGMFFRFLSYISILIIKKPKIFFAAE